MMEPMVTPQPFRRLSPDAADGWRSFCAIHGTTQTALAEAMGMELAQHADPDQLVAFLRPIVHEARRIAAERRGG
jgi:hypothetical protein